MHTTGLEYCYSRALPAPLRCYCTTCSLLCHPFTELSAAASSSSSGAGSSSSILARLRSDMVAPSLSDSLVNCARILALCVRKNTSYASAAATAVAQSDGSQNWDWPESLSELYQLRALGFQLGSAWGIGCSEPVEMPCVTLMKRGSSPRPVPVPVRSLGRFLGAGILFPSTW